MSIKQLVTANKKERQETRQLAEIAAALTGLAPAQVIELCDARIATREDEAIMIIADIYTALGFEEGHPQEAEVLEAIAAAHVTATDGGWVWTAEGYRKADKLYSLQQVKERIENELPPPAPQQPALLDAPKGRGVSYE